MKKLSAAASAILMLVLSSAGQKIEKPTLTAAPCTDTQKAVISVGTGLHDAQKYDEAIAKYQQVLEDNPECTMALYELSMSYYTKGDKNKALDAAFKGAKYKSNELPLFYLTIGNVLDDLGKGDQAVRLYNDAIKILEGNGNMLPHLSSLHYNLGVTYRRQQKDKEAREEMKRAIAANELYASPHYILSDIFYAGRYKIPALLAAARFISLEYNTDRTRRAAAMFDQIMGKTSAKKGPDEKIVINLDFGTPTDEGDFASVELVLAMVDAVGKTDEAKKKDLTAEEQFADRVDSLITFLDPKDKKLQGTFSAARYFPFMLEMKRRGYVKPFAYLVQLHNGSREAQNWLKQNETTTLEFLSWAKRFSVTQD